MIIKIGDIEARHILSCEAIATDNFSMIDDISAPRADISKKIIKFGEINSDNRVLDEVITITNSGASPLKLRRIESTSKAVECAASALTLQPMESAELRIRLYTELIRPTEGLLSERIRIITNDPIRPMQSIKVNAIIDWYLNRIKRIMPILVPESANYMNNPELLSLLSKSVEIKWKLWYNWSRDPLRFVTYDHIL